MDKTQPPVTTDLSIAADPPATAERSPRRWWIGALLSLAPPTGLLYVGKAFWFLVVLAINYLVFAEVLTGVFGWFFTPIGLMLVTGVQFGALFAAVIVTVWLSVRLKDYRLRPYNRPWVYALAVLAVWGPLAAERAFRWPERVTTYAMSSPLMIPTLLAGDYVVADRRGRVLAELAAGDVIVFNREGRVLAVRVIGMPGDVVRLVEGTPEINGALATREPEGVFEALIDDALAKLDVLREKLPSGRSYLVAGGADFAERTTDPVTLGENEFYLLGDNRANPMGSFAAPPDGFGAVLRDEILGRVTGTFWSSSWARIGGMIDSFTLMK